MPLTAAEWLKENSERQELAVMNIPLAMELYARYKADIEAVAFGDWIMKSGYIEHNAGDDEWTKKWVLYTSDNDQEYVTTEMLYSIFKKESNG